ncbi:uncharacterized protein BcabD6B2_08590 [Babesia caballi]|uniref:Uncharacterized protein n=1 Tax=Babesia caballi TaxID=5871 RepID=A0AAV4LS17_BABCB|nr:hypothetical protein, conserved [Babesia caballi]
MVNGKKSFKDPPENLRQAVDYATAVGGGFGTAILEYNNYTKVAVALKTLKGFNEIARETLKISEYDSIIKDLAQGLGSNFLGYAAQGGTEFSDSGIIGASKGYKSAYEKAEWPSTDPEQKQCAKIFLGASFAVYYCVSYLYWRCLNSPRGGWGDSTLAGANGLGPYNFLQSMGYTPGQFNNVKSGKEIANRLGDGHNGIDDFVKAPNSVSSDYSGFLQKLVNYDSGEALKHPLASCFLFAREYFGLQSKLPTNANQITPIIDEIKEKLITHSKTPGTSYKNTDMHNTYNDLNEKIADLFNKVSKFNPQQPHQETPAAEAAGTTDQPANKSSHAAPVAGTLTTLGLGGGAAAAYVLNIGGTKTLVNGLLKIG